MGTKVLLSIQGPALEIGVLFPPRLKFMSSHTKLKLQHHPGSASGVKQLDCLHVKLEFNHFIAAMWLQPSCLLF